MLHNRPLGTFDRADFLAPSPSRIPSGDIRQARSHFDKIRQVVILDPHRLTGECLARLISDHCPDLAIHVVDFSEAARASLDATSPDLVIINAHRCAFDEAEIGHTRRCPTLVIGKHANGSPSLSRVTDCAIAFPSDGDVSLLIAAIRLTLAGGRFVSPHAKPSSDH